MSSHNNIKFSLQSEVCFWGYDMAQGNSSNKELVKVKISEFHEVFSWVVSMDREFRVSVWDYNAKLKPPTGSSSDAKSHRLYYGDVNALFTNAFAAYYGRSNGKLQHQYQHQQQQDFSMQMRTNTKEARGSSFLRSRVAASTLNMHNGQQKSPSAFSTPSSNILPRSDNTSTSVSCGEVLQIGFMPCRASFAEAAAVTGTLLRKQMVSTTSLLASDTVFYVLAEAGVLLYDFVRGRSWVIPTAELAKHKNCSGENGHHGIERSVDKDSLKCIALVLEFLSPSLLALGCSDGHIRMYNYREDEQQWLFLTLLSGPGAGSAAANTKSLTAGCSVMMLKSLSMRYADSKHTTCPNVFPSFSTELTQAELEAAAGTRTIGGGKSFGVFVPAATVSPTVTTNKITDLNLLVSISQDGMGVCWNIAPLLYGTAIVKGHADVSSTHSTGYACSPCELIGRFAKEHRGGGMGALEPLTLASLKTGYSKCNWITFDPSAQVLETSFGGERKVRRWDMSVLLVATHNGINGNGNCDMDRESGAASGFVETRKRSGSNDSVATVATLATVEGSTKGGKKTKNSRRSSMFGGWGGGNTKQPLYEETAGASAAATAAAATVIPCLLTYRVTEGATVEWSALDGGSNFGGTVNNNTTAASNGPATHSAGCSVSLLNYPHYRRGSCYAVTSAKGYDIAIAIASEPLATYVPSPLSVDGGADADADGGGRQGLRALDEGDDSVSVSSHMSHSTNVTAQTQHTLSGPGISGSGRRDRDAKDRFQSTTPKSQLYTAHTLGLSGLLRNYLRHTVQANSSIGQTTHHANSGSSLIADVDSILFATLMQATKESHIKIYEVRNNSCLASGDGSIKIVAATNIGVVIIQLPTPRVSRVGGSIGAHSLWHNGLFLRCHPYVGCNDSGVAVTQGLCLESVEYGGSSSSDSDKDKDSHVNSTGLDEESNGGQAKETDSSSASADAIVGADVDAVTNDYFYSSTEAVTVLDRCSLLSMQLNSTLTSGHMSSADTHHRSHSSSGSPADASFNGGDARRLSFNATGPNGGAGTVSGGPSAASVSAGAPGSGTLAKVRRSMCQKPSTPSCRPLFCPSPSGRLCAVWWPDNYQVLVVNTKSLLASYRSPVSGNHDCNLNRYPDHDADDSDVDNVPDADAERFDDVHSESELRRRVGAVSIVDRCEAACLAWANVNTTHTCRDVTVNSDVVTNVQSVFAAFNSALKAKLRKEAEAAAAVEAEAAEVRAQLQAQAEAEAQAALEVQAAEEARAEAEAQAQAQAEAEAEVAAVNASEAEAGSDIEAQEAAVPAEEEEVVSAPAASWADEAGYRHSESAAEEEEEEKDEEKEQKSEPEPPDANVDGVGNPWAEDEEQEKEEEGSVESSTHVPPVITEEGADEVLTAVNDDRNAAVVEDSSEEEEVAGGKDAAKVEEDVTEDAIETVTTKGEANTFADTAFPSFENSAISTTVSGFDVDFSSAPDTALTNDFANSVSAPAAPVPAPAAMLEPLVPDIDPVEDTLVICTPAKCFETGVQVQSGVLGLFGLGRSNKDGKMAFLPSYIEVRSYETVVPGASNPDTAISAEPSIVKPTGSEMHVSASFSESHNSENNEQAEVNTFDEVLNSQQQKVECVLTENNEDGSCSGVNSSSGSIGKADPSNFVAVTTANEVTGLPDPATIVEMFSGPLVCVVYTRSIHGSGAGAGARGGQQKALSQVERNAQMAAETKNTGSATGGTVGAGSADSSGAEAAPATVLCSQFYLVRDAYTETHTTTHLTTVLRPHAPDAPLPPKPPPVTSVVSHKSHITEFVSVGAEFPAASHVTWCYRTGLVALAVGNTINIFQLVSTTGTESDDDGDNPDDPFADPSSSNNSNNNSRSRNGRINKRTTVTEQHTENDTVTREKELPKGAKLPEGVKLSPDITSTVNAVTTVSTSYSASAPRVCRLVPIACTSRYSSVPAPLHEPSRWHSAHVVNSNITHLYWTSGKGLVVSSIMATSAAVSTDGIVSSDVCMLVLPTLSDESMRRNRKKYLNHGSSSGGRHSDEAIPLHPVVVLPIINPSSAEARLYADRGIDSPASSSSSLGALRLSNNAAVCSRLAHSPCTVRPECLGLRDGCLLFTTSHGVLLRYSLLEQSLPPLLITETVTTDADGVHHTTLSRVGAPSPGVVEGETDGESVITDESSSAAAGSEPLLYAAHNVLLAVAHLLGSSSTSTSASVKTSVGSKEAVLHQILQWFLCLGSSDRHSRALAQTQTRAQETEGHGVRLSRPERVLLDMVLAQGLGGDLLVLLSTYLKQQQQQKEKTEQQSVREHQEQEELIKDYLSREYYNAMLLQFTTKHTNIVPCSALPDIVVDKSSGKKIQKKFMDNKNKTFNNNKGSRTIDCTVHSNNKDNSKGNMIENINDVQVVVSPFDANSPPSVAGLALCFSKQFTTAAATATDDEQW